MIKFTSPSKEFSIWGKIFGAISLVIIIFNVYYTNKIVHALIKIPGMEIRPTFHIAFLGAVVFSTLSLFAFVLMHLLSYAENKKIVLPAATSIIWLILFASILSGRCSFIATSNAIQKYDIRIAP